MRLGVTGISKKRRVMKTNEWNGIGFQVFRDFLKVILCDA
jgi:hypothetical protein